MGFFKGLTQKKPKSEAVVQAQEEAPDFEKVNWMKDPGLRKLYFYAFVLCVASATTGYDGYVSSTPTSSKRLANAFSMQNVLQLCPELRLMAGVL